jgi:glycolate oxidase FAD binding subunit
MSTLSTARPTDLRALRDAVLDSAGPIGIAGAGTAAEWGGRLGPVDTVLDTSGLTGVIVHNPGDMTVAVRAGTPLRELASELASHGQHVAFDAARVAAGATIGGLVATADSGPCALVYGSLRDLVIGVTVVLADGTVARSGGHVIKNVAGYDMAKLLHGSYGTLGVLAEVVLRLHPVPKGDVTVAVDCTLAQAAEAAAAVLAGQFEPAACEWITSTDSDGTLLVRLEGTRDALPARAASLREALAAVPALSEREDEREDDSGGGDGVWAEHARVTRGDDTGAVLRVGVRPSELPRVLAGLPTTAVSAGLGTGIATITLDPDAVATAHSAVHAAGGTSSLRARPDGSDAPAWGPPPSALPVLKAVKAELDPDGRLGPGRFDPWMAP